MKHVTSEDYPRWVYDGLKNIAHSEEELEELLYQWDERVGIMHYDGGVEMKTAEKEAFQSVLQRLRGGKAE